MVNDRLIWLLDTEHENTSEEIKDKLYRYQDITDKKARKLLTKRVDSNSEIERAKALQDIIAATLLCNNETRLQHIKGTTAFFVKKLKNEAIDRRQSGLKTFFDGMQSNIKEILQSSECLDSIVEMLDDSLEVQGMHDYKFGFYFYFYFYFYFFFLVL